MINRRALRLAAAYIETLRIRNLSSAALPLRSSSVLQISGFGGIAGSAYFIGGFGFTALNADGVVVVPIHTGVGVRLGINISYLKFTPRATWNPF